MLLCASCVLCTCKPTFCAHCGGLGPAGYLQALTLCTQLPVLCGLGRAMYDQMCATPWRYACLCTQCVLHVLPSWQGLHLQHATACLYQLLAYQAGAAEHHMHSAHHRPA